MKYKRSGDHYFHEIKKLPENLKEVKHEGQFIFGVGEASNHNHVIVCDKPTDLIIKQDESGGYYFELFAPAKLMHLEGDSQKVADHKTIFIQPGIYKQVREREVDIFTQITRKVVD